MKFGILGMVGKELLLWLKGKVPFRN